jgi:signal transduction histidine kinase
MKSEFVSSVSHELKTPLTTIKTLTHVLDKSDVSKKERRDYLKAIAAECDRQIDLVSNLLDLSQIEAGKFALPRTEVNVYEVLRQCFDTQRHAAEARGQKINLEVEKDLPLVIADGKALRRVICGLIENAIKYSSEEGRITISASEAGKEVAISVTDNGCGILPDDLPHIFDKFYRGRPFAKKTPCSDSRNKNDAPGVGLGLYLARTIVEQFGGHIEADNLPTGGAVFTVYLDTSEGDLEEIVLVEEKENVETIAGS